MAKWLSAHPRVGDTEGRDVTNRDLRHCWRLPIASANWRWFVDLKYSRSSQTGAASRVVSTRTNRSEGSGGSTTASDAIGYIRHVGSHRATEQAGVTTDRASNFSDGRVGSRCAPDAALAGRWMTRGDRGAPRGTKASRARVSQPGELYAATRDRVGGKAFPDRQQFRFIVALVGRAEITDQRQSSAT